MSEASHVPTPYQYKYRDWRGQPSIHAHISGAISVDEDEDGNPEESAVSVCVVPGNDTSEPVTRLTAEFICRAANCHTDLLAALEGVLRVADRETVEFDAARAAIAKARGQAK